MLLYYPYQSIRPFIAMLRRLPGTLRSSLQDDPVPPGPVSQIVQALVDAAENGKEVVALVELRARFDEQNNIDGQAAGGSRLYCGLRL